MTFFIPVFINRPWGRLVEKRGALREQPPAIFGWKRRIVWEDAEKG